MLRNREFAGVKFRRQDPIGGFIVDYCWLERRLAIELDGGQHAEQREADEARTQFLEGRGYRVLRFWNEQVLKQPDEVLEQIFSSLENDENG